MKKRQARKINERKNQIKLTEKGLRKNYDRKEPSADWLKYFRVVRYYVKKRHGLGLGDLEMLMFLYSEGLFNKSSFLEFEQIFSWDASRFNRLLEEKFIVMWRKSTGSESALYEVSHKTRQMIAHVYKKLLGEETISEDRYINPIFSSEANYTDKVYRRAIKRFNQEQRQRHAPE